MISLEYDFYYNMVYFKGVGWGEGQDMIYWIYRYRIWNSRGGGGL